MENPHLTPEARAHLEAADGAPRELRGRPWREVFDELDQETKRSIAQMLGEAFARAREDLERGLPTREQIKEMADHLAAGLNKRLRRGENDDNDSRS